MATDKLSIYNNALLHCGSESLRELTENREPRRKLDQVWADGRFVRSCLELGDWNHAIKTIRLDYDPSVEPDFGYRYAFEKPEDWVRTVALSASEDFRPPLQDYDDEAGFWWASVDKLFIKHVSDDEDYGLDYSKWAESFTEFVEYRLAVRVFKRLTAASADFDELKKDARRALMNARGKDSRNQPAVKQQGGSWAKARGGRRFFDRRGDN